MAAAAARGTLETGAPPQREGKTLMEVVPLGSADEIAAIAADVFEAIVRPQAGRGARTRHRVDAAADVPRADPPPRCRRRPFVRRGDLLQPRRVRRPAGRARAELPGDHRPRADRRPGHQPGAGQRARPQPRRPAHGRRALRGADRGGRRCRRAAARRRRRRPPGLQRARFLTRQPHPDQDPHRPDPEGQRALLRLARTRCRSTS